ncbi:PREDICTED: kallikrein-11-like [Wasmannia auropunctata]|uniref:kallikrein-11-like n=1 Tax=Wasmannia auropunctata TaxID=64793 RepID=UPI0005EDA656|nr:PREDICTED: kallikrein-11-like [Wasmannia auropunctata]
MMKLIILLAVTIAQRAYCGETEPFIVGGDKAVPGQFPHQVSLQVQGQHICGGSIISPTCIATAAHCVDDPRYNKYMTVVSGTNDLNKNGKRHQIKCIRIHPGYSNRMEDGWKDDIAIITLANPITMNDLQRTIPLANKEEYGGKRGIISGWGQLSEHNTATPNMLRWVTVNVLSQNQCLNAHRFPRTNPGQMCTQENRKGVCSGDSGGPLVVNGQLVGLVSWSPPCGSGQAEVFTHVYKYLDFIQQSKSIGGSLVAVDNEFVGVVPWDLLCVLRISDVYALMFTKAYCGETEPFIVGGNYARPGQFAHQVSLQVFGGQQFCGGSIIDSTHILTAAHCVDNPEYTNDMTVVTGTNMIARGSGNKHEIKCIRIHPGYTGEKADSWKDDVAVITLKEPIVFNNLQKAIRLASRNYTTGASRGIVSGWGRTDVNAPASPVLKYVDVNVLSQQSCLQRRGYPPTRENQICTLDRVGNGACSGDSGGPVIVGDELVGVVSWVTLCALGVPDVHTNVYKYLDFIKQSQSMTC